MDFFKLKDSHLELGNRLITSAFVLFFLIVLIRTAWISDDAAITLRTVLNLKHGLGPTFNINERVQAYTHPLWFLILSLVTSIVGNIFWATFVTSILISMAAFILLLSQFGRSLGAAVLIGFALVLSKAFVDFSTSGLENPLSHLILLLAVILASSICVKGKDKRASFFLVCSCLYLNRPDLFLVLFPLLLFLVFESINQPRYFLRISASAIIPVILWTVFSLFYYGFPFPNTAYAKLGNGIPMDERFFQGLRYLLHSLKRDPVTIFIISSGLVFGFLGSRLNRLLSAGVLLYLIYIVTIGGDFMEGRFLTPIFFLALIILVMEFDSRWSKVFLCSTVIILGSINIPANILAGTSYSNPQIFPNGIADERGVYYPGFGLLTAKENTFITPDWHIPNRKTNPQSHTIILCGDLGFSSIKSGPGVHFIDTCGLADPLLSRLPAKRTRNWRIGHFFRQLPLNYKESIELGGNLLVDTQTKLFWDSIRLVTRGPLFDKNRIFEIARLNLGHVQKPDWNLYR